MLGLRQYSLILFLVFNGMSPLSTWSQQNHQPQSHLGAAGIPENPDEPRQVLGFVNEHKSLDAQQTGCARPGANQNCPIEATDGLTVTGVVLEYFSAPETRATAGRVDFYIREDGTGLYYQFVNQDGLVCIPLISPCLPQNRQFRFPLSQYIGSHLQLRQSWSVLGTGTFTYRRVR